MAKKRSTKAAPSVPYRIEKATSLLNGFERAIDILEGWGGKENVYCWFRGVKSNKLKLQPGAYWRTGYSELGPMLDLCQQGIRFTPVSGMNSWSTYYLAQHHGIPTRLLDWTESFIAAVFFAIDGASSTDTPCVWLLQPTILNGTLFGYAGLVSPEHNESLNIWLPKEVGDHKVVPSRHHDGDAEYDNYWPVAIYPRQDNNRIQVQKGYFTVHGSKLEAIEDVLVAKHGCPEEVIARVDFDGVDLKVMRTQMELLGTRRSSIYPDVDNFVRELKEMYQWV
ncbi:FRG domain-containing protein [Roseimicrobium gellanilyticum]|uniref:FRG domain-containing protein n=1 Tax=Roseimicrobium gellanilyticum TaxID=748857 RepID=A0A366HRN3_9BACT|nr:FRG domain-containing protein [Roseimicrobium gellanilyticum]RBP45212.1 FRG domain-containing protein [Roseimicrobium gellanilyticum]